MTRQIVPLQLLFENIQGISSFLSYVDTFLETNIRNLILLEMNTEKADFSQA